MPLSRKRQDLNSCNANQLADVEGVTKPVARRIIAHRNLHGEFMFMDDLLGIRGVGERLLSSIAEHFFILPRTRSRTSMSSSRNQPSVGTGVDSPSRKTTPHRRRSRSPLHRSKSPAWKSSMRKPSIPSKQDRLKSMVSAGALRIDSSQNINLDIDKLAGEGCNLTLCGGGPSSGKALLTINVKDIKDATQTSDARNKRSLSPVRKSILAVEPAIDGYSSRSVSRSRSVSPGPRLTSRRNSSAADNKTDDTYVVIRDTVRTSESFRECMESDLSTRSPSPVRFRNQHLITEQKTETQLVDGSSTRGSSPIRGSPLKRKRNSYVVEKDCPPMGLDRFETNFDVDMPGTSSDFQTKRRSRIIQSGQLKGHRESPKKKNRRSSSTSRGQPFKGPDIESWLLKSQKELEKSVDIDGIGADLPMASSTPADGQSPNKGNVVPEVHERQVEVTHETIRSRTTGEVQDDDKSSWLQSKGSRVHSGDHSPPIKRHSYDPGTNMQQEDEDHFQMNDAKMQQDEIEFDDQFNDEHTRHRSPRDSFKRSPRRQLDEGFRDGYQQISPEPDAERDNEDGGERSKVHRHRHQHRHSSGVEREHRRRHGRKPNPSSVSAPWCVII